MFSAAPTSPSDQGQGDSVAEEEGEKGWGPSRVALYLLGDRGQYRAWHLMTGVWVLLFTVHVTLTNTLLSRELPCS